MLSRSPEGYRQLLAYKKAQTLQQDVLQLVSLFPKSKTYIDLADQMSRSARSATKNIVEGWKRNSTKEYFDFLGFAIGSNAEMMEDLGDIATGVYRELMGIRGIIGEKGETGTKGAKNKQGIMGEKRELRIKEAKGEKEIMGEKGINGKKGTTHSTPDTLYTHQTLSSPLSSLDHPPLSSHSTPSTPYSRAELDKLKFYPLDTSLSAAVQLFLRAKEVNFLLYKLQKSLDLKMDAEKTRPQKERLGKILQEERRRNEEFDKMLRQHLKGDKKGGVTGGMGITWREEKRIEGDKGSKG